MPAASPRPQAPLIVRVNYAIRAGAFAYAFLTLGVHALDRGLGQPYWIFLAVVYLLYPHLVYHYTSRAAQAKNAEVLAMYVDAGLLGATAGSLGFPTWIVYPALFSTSLNATWIRGAQGALFSVSSFSLGCSLAVAATGLRYLPETSSLVTALCFFGSVVYAGAIGYTMHEQTRRLAMARDARRESDDRYRLIAENAAELIALLDESGRWIYASPSFERLLERADLEPGADALRRVHPDDADRVRVAVVRSAALGKPQELTLRLVDRDGRVRSLKARMQAIADGGASVDDGVAPASVGITPALRKVVFVADDLTDLREGEERLLLAAHALEGMTEAILITAADGTVVTVNRAFTQVTGYSREEVLGGAEKEIRNALQPPEFYDDLYAVVQREGYWSGTTWARRKNGSVYREWRSTRAVRDDSGKPTHYVTVFYEVGASRSREEGSLKA
jgi:PAS domain S-box-containing protein